MCGVGRSQPCWSGEPGLQQEKSPPVQAPAKGTGASLNHTGEKRTIGVTDKICILAALLCLTASGSSQGFVGCPIYNVGLLRTSDAANSTKETVPRKGKSKTSRSGFWRGPFGW